MSLNPVNYSRYAVIKNVNKATDVKAASNRINAEPTYDAINEMLKKLRRATAAAQEYREDSSRIRELAADAYREIIKQQNVIRFEYNRDGSGELVVKVVNRSSGTVVHQFPPPETLNLKKLAKYMPGIFLDYTG